jgi:hypothetical protein
VLVLDSEGMGSPGNEKVDMKIFSLVVLLSSYFVYNSEQSINKKSIDDLALVSHLAEYVREANEFPTFLWVL